VGRSGTGLDDPRSVGWYLHDRHVIQVTRGLRDPTDEATLFEANTKIGAGGPLANKYVEEVRKYTDLYNEVTDPFWPLEWAEITVSCATVLVYAAVNSITSCRIYLRLMVL
jgi:hypothetical protein